jgi:hypothetical protein
VPEHAQVRELVDDDRVERLGRRQHQPPREREAAGARGASPAGALVPDRDPGSLHAEGRRVAGDCALDGVAGAPAQPRLEHVADGPAVRGRQANHELVLGVAADPGHR